MSNHLHLFFITTLLFGPKLIQALDQSAADKIFFCFKEYCNPNKHAEMIPAKDNQIKAIIFDLNGVIIETSKKGYFKAIPYLFKYALLRLWKKESLNIEKFFENAIKDIPGEFPFDPDKVAYHKDKPLIPILNDWQCGRDIYQTVINHINAKKIPKSDKKFLKLIAKLLLNPEYFATSKVEISHSVQILRDLKDAGYKIYVLSNWDAQSFPFFMKKNHEFMDLFDGIMTSGNEQLVKPNIDFYHKCLSKFNLRADQSLFVDDQEINVEGARKAGIHAFLFNANDKESILEQFQKYNVVKK